MRFRVPVILGVASGAVVWFCVPHARWTAVAWIAVCATVALAVVDVLVWQTIKGLDDYATRFQGPSSALETVLSRVWERKKTAFVLFLINFFIRTVSATLFGAITTGKVSAIAHPVIFCSAIAACVFSIPILTQQVVSYWSIGKELGAQMLRARRESERVEELKRAAERPSPMIASDEHTAGYTKVIPWKERGTE